MMKFDQETLSNLENVASREWLVTNGIGGYASSTLTGMNTRRYHGLLVAAVDPPAVRRVVLERVEEEVRQGTQEWFLATSHYGRIIHPRGFQYAHSFEIDPFPALTWEFGGNQLRKTVFMIHGENTTVISYSFLSGEEPLELNLYPLLTWRGYHELLLEPLPEMSRILINQGVQLQCGDSRAMISMLIDQGEFVARETVYRGLYLAEEAARGFDAVEDSLVPGHFRIRLHPGQSVSLLASTDVMTFPDSAERLYLKEVKRLEATVSDLPVDDEFTARLALAGAAFRVKHSEPAGNSIIAGYHWFADWSRDTMISLPGLTLCLGHYQEAFEILRHYAAHVQRGLLPNRFPDTRDGLLEYNSMDAPLWFVHAVGEYHRYSGDLKGIRLLLPAVQQIMEAYIDGTDFGIGLNDDFLIQGGDDSENLTWMDGVIAGRPVTPRAGCPVEITALFYHALFAAREIAFACGLPDPGYQRLAVHVQESFRRVFVRDDGKGLYDRIGPEGPVAEVRPNQLLAVSLRHSPLTRFQARLVVQTVERELLVPTGIRSLAPGSPGYRGQCVGNPRERDMAYHQGTAWCWLLGPFITARMRVHEYSRSSREEAIKLLQPVKNHLDMAGLGTISEICDGDQPFTPRGCIAQAWSVAEILRAYLEDVQRLMPKPPLEE